VGGVTFSSTRQYTDPPPYAFPHVSRAKRTPQGGIRPCFMKRPTPLHLTPVAPDATAMSHARYRFAVLLHGSRPAVLPTILDLWKSLDHRSSSARFAALREALEQVPAGSIFLSPAAPSQISVT